MCKNSYIKYSNKTNMNMIFCHLFDDKSNELEQICQFQRYCTDKGEYIFNKEERCKENK